jgi:hypothetical protein
MTPAEKKYDDMIFRRFIIGSGTILLILIGLSIHAHYHPDPIPQICLQTETVPHVEVHYTSTGGEYKTLEYKCIKQVPDPNYK